MATTFEWNNSTGRYWAYVDNDLIEVDGDTYAETRRDHIKHAAQEEGYTCDIEELPEDVYNRLYDVAESYLDDTSVWTFSTPCEGLYINGEDRSER